MIKKQQQFLIKGMNQDIAETKVQPELAHSIKNLRVITDEDSGTLSLVTEKGTLAKNVSLSNVFFLKNTSINYNLSWDVPGNFSNVNSVDITDGSDTTLRWYYKYAIQKFTVVFKFNSSTLYNQYSMLGRMYFPNFVSINNNLSTGTNYNIDNKYSYRTMFDGQGSTSLHCVIYKNGSAVSGSDFYIDFSNCFSKTFDDENRTITVQVPCVEFRHTINNDVNTRNAFANAPLFVNTEIEKWIKQNSEYLDKNTYSFTVKQILGNAVISNDLYIFGKAESDFEQYDYIAKVEDFNNEATFKFLYVGKLGFDVNYPIKTYVSFESEEQKRIYWIDGKNQPRVINVSKNYELDDNNTDNHFDFCSQLPTSQTINIKKNNFSGTFHSGVVQYFFTYVDKNEQESKIFYQSPLYYITRNERSASPEEMCSCSFNIKISSINNSNWLRKQIRCYSIQRTSLNTEVTAKVVSVISLKDDDNTVNFVDNGQIGYSIDPQILFALGCEEFVPQTFAIKNNTMFFGNVQIKDVTSRSNFPDFSNLTVSIETNRNIKKRATDYVKEFQLSEVSTNEGSDQGIKGFMFQEEYMLGLQFLHKNGSWSEPIWVCDKKMTKAPTTGSSGEYHSVPYFSANIGSEKAAALINNDYIQVRPLVVCNEYANARVLCNGILNPTVYYTDGNAYMSSWFFRPLTSSGIIGNYTAKSLGFRFITNGDNHTSSSSATGVGSRGILNEIQGETTGEHFQISQEYITFNSPDIEFGKVSSITDDYKLFYSGYYEIHANKYDSDIRTSTLPLNEDGGFKRKKGQYSYDINPNTGTTDSNGNQNSGMTFLGGNCWYDKFDTSTTDNGTGNIQIYPWENDTSYIGYPKTEDIIYSAPESKTITNWRLSQYCTYFSGETVTDNFYDIIDDIKVVNDPSTFIKASSNNNVIYYKDTDILFLPSSLSVYSTGSPDSKVCTNAYPVRIQYRSTPHILIRLDRSALPCFLQKTGSNPYNQTLGYRSYGGAFAINFEASTADNYACLLQGTLVNNSYDSSVSSHFGGRDGNGKPTENSLNNSKWLIAGKSINLVNTGVTVEWISGDTYYQRYNCLKTYPYSHESKNSIIEIASVMIQTRVNIDGTYDAQKGDILHIEPANFNLLNDVYSQEDNFFTFRNITTKTYNDFKNTIFWTPHKNFGNEIDTWCNVRLGNSIDLNGNGGEITAIVNWNDNLLVFQNKAIHKLNYNENTILNGQKGLPVILQGSDKITGTTLISGQFGCQNEWSIVNAKSGLYFSDDYNHKLYVLSDGIKCISDELGFKSYLKNKNYSGVWTPNRNKWIELGGGVLHTYYDQQLGDIYFTDGASCLTYNENLNLFTAFYDYVDTTNAKLFDFVNIENKNYWVLNDFTNNTPLFYEHRAIDNLNIFGSNRGYEVELTSNIDPHLDKIFDTVEIRGDSSILSFTAVTNPTGNPKAQDYYEVNTENQYVKTNDTTIVSQKTYYTRNADILQSGYNIVSNVNTTSLPFDTIEVNNEYQDTGTKELQFTKDVKTNSAKNSIKQKFRIWRAQIGRDATNTRDRIRNYWSRIKLTKNGVANLRAKIHDIVVDVYE